MKHVRMFFDKSIEFVTHEGITLVFHARQYYHIAEADVAALLEQGVAKLDQELVAEADQAKAEAAEDQKAAEGSSAPVAAE